MKKLFTLLCAVCLLSNTSFAQIPNSDFETWINIGGWFENPESWQTNNTQITIAQVNKDADAYSGMFAARLTNYTPIVPSLQAKFPITAHPAHLNAWVKSTVNGSDSVWVQVKLSQSGNYVDSGRWVAYTSNTGYTMIGIPISYTVAETDTATIEIHGGTQYGTDLKIDHLEFDYDFNGIPNEEKPCETAALQNPFYESIVLDVCPQFFVMVEIRVFDITGKLLQSAFVKDNESRVNMNASVLPAGMYICVIKQGDKLTTLKLLKQ